MWHPCSHHLVPEARLLEVAVAKPGIRCRTWLLERWLKIPLVLVGALVLQHRHTDRKNLNVHAWDAALGLRNGKVTTCLWIASWEQPEEKWEQPVQNRFNPGYTFQQKKIYLIWKSIWEQRARVPECCISVHTLSRGGSKAVAQGRSKLMNLESQRLWSLTGFWGLLWSIEWNVNFRGLEVSQFSITQWHLISSLKWDNPCISCTLTPGTTADPSRPAEVQVLDFKTSLFPLFWVLQRAEGALAAAKSGVSSHCVSNRTAHTWLPGKDKNRTFLGICHPLQILWQTSTQPLADLDPQRGGQIKASHIPCCVWHTGWGPSTACILGGTSKTCLSQPKICPSLGYGEATSAEMPGKEVGKWKGTQWAVGKEGGKNKQWIRSESSGTL